MNRLVRTATMGDLDIIAQMEAECFPKLEAASRESIQQRLMTFPNHFWLLEVGGIVVSCINGCVTNKRTLVDEMFANTTLHRADGAWQMIFGVMTFPKYQGQGYAAYLMKQVIAACELQGRKGVVLTCKDKLIPFYEQFGYINEGRSVSNHGGVAWNELRITF